MDVTLYMEQIKHWGMKGGLAVLDQGFFSGSNFLLNILLARWLSPEEYGAFALAFTVYLFFSSFHNALVLEPMSVLGQAKYSDQIKSYLGGQVFIHMIVTGLSGFLIGFIGFLLLSLQLVEESLSLFLIGVGIFLPLMLLMWLARRSCYVAGQPGWALVSSLVYSLVLIFGAFIQHNQTSPVHPSRWYLLLGVASLIGAMLIYVNPNIVSFEKTRWLPWLREQWIFGKWIVLSTFLYFAGTQVQLLIVATQLGLDQAGAFRALQNFILPMMQVLTAVSTLMLPSFSLEFGRQNFRVMPSKAVKVIVGLTMIAAVYLLVLWVFSEPVEQLLYAGRFANYAALIPLFGLVPLITAIETGFSLVVRSLQRPVYYLISTAAIAIPGVALSLIFVRLWAVQGAILSLILVAMVSLAVNVWFYRQWFIPVLIVEPVTE